MTPDRARHYVCILVVLVTLLIISGCAMFDPPVEQQLGSVVSSLHTPEMEKAIREAQLK